MPLVSPIIERAAALVADSMYLRATDVQMNIDVGELDLKDKVAILYNNLPTVKHKAAAGVQREYPVEIKILKLAGGSDDDTKQGDAIRAELIPYADLMFDYCTKAVEVSNVKITEQYEIDFQNQVKIYDDIMTGLVVKFILYFDRQYFCIPEPE